MRTIAVTGATGFIGRHIVDEFLNAGWRVIALCRNPAAQTASDRLEFRPFELRHSDSVALEDVDALVHCALEAYRDTKGAAEPVNVDGSRRLFTSARAQGVSKIVFVSSTTARETTPSEYGREKYQVEQFLDSARDLIVRPGLVIGNGGLFRSMYRALSKRGIAPLFFRGEKPVYSISVEDLTSAIRRLVEADACGLYVLAAANAISLKMLYRLIGRKAGRPIRLVPLPYAVTLFTVMFLERLGVSLPVSSGTIRGIANMQAIDVPQYELLGMTIRPCDAALESTNMAEPAGR